MVRIDLSGFDLDFVPKQKPITEGQIREMLGWTPRRMKLSKEYTDHYGLRPPYKADADWAVWFPFQETYAPAFEAMCLDPTIGMRPSSGNKCFTFLSGTAGETDPPADAAKCCGVLGCYVGIRDCMALSFALDYDHEGGKPERPHTEVGRLRDLAKPRDGKRPSASEYQVGLDGLTARCFSFLDDLTVYLKADGVVAMPSSDPEKPFDLPRDLAARISEKLGIPNLSENVRTKDKRGQLKEVSAGDRLDAITGTIEVDEGTFRGKTIVLVDDVYQSGVSMNYVAMLLQDAGAKRLYGLACDKTCSNTDNVS